MFIKKHALACMIFLSGSFSAAAAPVTYDFSGTIDFVVGNALKNDIDQNTSTVSGNFIYDVDAIFDGVQYNTAITGFNFDFGTTGGLVSVFVADDGRMLVDPTFWAFNRGTPDAIILPNSSPDFLGAIQFGATVNLPLAPALPLDLSVFTDAFLELQFREPVFGGNAGRALYNITNITARNITPPMPSVPEPAPLALLGLGLVGIGFMKRRKVQS